MAEGNHADAYRYFVKAIRTNPGLSFAWSNLGVLYRKNNQHGAAETCYLQGLSVTGGSRDTSVMTIMNNMANLYDITGEKEKEALYKNRLVSFRKKNPYYQYASARKAYNDNLFSESLRLFREAIRLKDDEHLFYYGLALAYLKTGDIKHAVFNFDRAIQYSWDNAKKGYYRQVRDSLISMQ
jgi:Flp pilus assembly protein TadD